MELAHASPTGCGAGFRQHAVVGCQNVEEQSARTWPGGKAGARPRPEDGIVPLKRRLASFLPFQVNKRTRTHEDTGCHCHCRTRRSDLDFPGQRPEGFTLRWCARPRLPHRGRAAGRRHVRRIDTEGSRAHGTVSSERASRPARPRRRRASCGWSSTRITRS